MASHTTNATKIGEFNPDIVLLWAITEGGKGEIEALIAMGVDPNTQMGIVVLLHSSVLHIVITKMLFKCSFPLVLISTLKIVMVGLPLCLRFYLPLLIKK